MDITAEFVDCIVFDTSKDELCVCVVDRNLGPRCTETGNPSRIYIDIDALEIDGSQDDTAELRHFFLLHFPSSSMYSPIETFIIPALFGSAKWGPHQF